MRNQYIYRQRCLKKSFSSYGFKCYVYEIQNSEKYYAKKSNKFSKHLKKWDPANFKSTNCQTDFNEEVFVREFIDTKLWNMYLPSYVNV